MNNINIGEDVMEPFLKIAEELEKANQLKKVELVLKYGEREVDDALHNPYI